MKKGLVYSLGLSRKTFSSNFTPILAILIISVTTITPIFFNLIYVMVLWIVFLFMAFNTNTNSNRKLGILLTLGAIFVSICAIYAFLGVSSASLAYCIHNPLMYFAPVLALMVIDRCHNEQQIRFLFHALALAIAINIADNIWLTYKIGLYNIVYSKLAGAVMEEEGLTGLNLGGSGFVSMAVFYTCTMFMAFLKSNKWKEKSLFLIYTGISMYFITFCSLKASAFLFMLMSMALMYVSVKSEKHIGMSLILIILGGGLIFLFSDNIIYFFIKIIDSDRMTARLTVFTTGGELEDSSSMSTREGLWQLSLKSWLGGVGNFFFGIGDHNSRSSSSLEASGVGNHSDMFDVLARYGIIGALILYTTIKIYYDYLQKRFGSIFKFEILSFIILLLAIGFTKRFLTAQQAIVIFILFPLTLKYFYNQKTI